MKASSFLVLVTLVVGLVTVVAPGVVIAQGDPQTFETDPAIAAGVDGPVWISHLIGDELWIGGDFDGIRNAPFGDPVLVTKNLAVMNINTGDVVSKAFDFDGTVYGIAYRDEVVYVVGNFDTYNGEPAHNVVALDFVTLERVDGFTAASNDQLRDVAYHDGWLYLAGNLNDYNGTDVNRVVRVDPVTGALDAEWTTDIVRFVEAIDVSGDYLVAAERNSDPSAEVKLIDIATGDKLQGLDPLVDDDGGIWDAKFSPDGQFVYTATVFNRINKYTLEDEREWVTERGDGDMQAVASTDSLVFAGFHDGWLGNENRRLVAFDPDDGSEEDWYVEMNSYWGVRDLEVYDQGLVAVGEFSNVNGINARRVAIFRPNGDWSPAAPILAPEPTPTPEPTPSPTPVPGLSGDVNCDDSSDVVDALVIAQYAVGVRTAVASCPLPDPAANINIDAGDADDDGNVGIVDALLVAQCSVGNVNAFCPA